MQVISKRYYRGKKHHTQSLPESHKVWRVKYLVEMRGTISGVEI